MVASLNFIRYTECTEFTACDFNTDTKARKCCCLAPSCLGRQSEVSKGEKGRAERAIANPGTGYSRPERRPASPGSSARLTEGSKAALPQCPA